MLEKTFSSVLHELERHIGGRVLRVAEAQQDRDQEKRQRLVHIVKIIPLALRPAALGNECAKRECRYILGGGSS